MATCCVRRYLGLRSVRYRLNLASGSFAYAREFIQTPTIQTASSSSMDAPIVTSLSQREAMEHQSKHRIYPKNEMRWKQIIEKQEQDGRAYGHLTEVF